MEIIQGLQNKNNQEAYQLLLMLEERSAESDELYSCFEDFPGLLKNRSSFVQVRGFRLACAQAKWDEDGKLCQHLDALLAMLDRAKPTAVRQCLTALEEASNTVPSWGKPSGRCERFIPAAAGPPTSRRPGTRR